MSSAEKLFQNVDYDVEYKARYRTIDMKIRDFLAMARPGFDQRKADDVKDLLNRGVKFESVPYLYFDLDGNTARVTGHEGRHRARALLELGYSKMPVTLKGPIRWSEQTPGYFDYIEDWPGVMVSETGSAKIPFPISRGGTVTAETIDCALADLADRQDPFRLTEHYMDIPLSAQADGSTHVGAGVLFCCGEKVLFVLRSAGSESPGTWAGLGGGVEPGETIEQGVRREVAEEARYTLPYELIQLHKCRSENYVFHNYFAFVTEEFIPALNDEHTDYVWTDTLPNPIHPKLMESLRAYRK